MRVSQKVNIRLFCLLYVSLSVAAGTFLKEVNNDNDTLGSEVNATAGDLNKQKRHGPIVQANANQVELQFVEGTYYVGKLYIGSDYWLTNVIFDTRTPWTGVVLDNAVGSDSRSVYSTDISTTRIPYKPTGDQILRKTIVSNTNRLSGDVYRDQMCLF